MYFSSHFIAVGVIALTEFLLPKRYTSCLDLSFVCVYVILFHSFARAYFITGLWALSKQVNK
jgi:hypothetical protein